MIVKSESCYFVGLFMVVFFKNKMVFLQGFMLCLVFIMMFLQYIVVSCEWEGFMFHFVEDSYNGKNKNNIKVFIGSKPRAFGFEQ